MADAIWSDKQIPDPLDLFKIQIQAALQLNALKREIQVVLNKLKAGKIKD